MTLVCIARSRTAATTAWRVVSAAGLLGALSSCIVEQYCFSNEDCQVGLACLPSTGRCMEGQCVTAAQCQPNQTCHARICVPRQVGPLTCPPEMANIDNVFCMDRYEASRPDATATQPGIDESRATSRQGVIPWQVAGNQQAEAACMAAGKDLCTIAQWQGACEGPLVTDYPYGEVYDPLVCNGTDTFCACGPGTGCPSQSPCPFANCHDTCGSAFRLLPTGSGSRCKTPHGVFDMSGNLWEHIKGGDNARVRGGGYNSVNAERVHRCEFVPGFWAPEAIGFRCCMGASL